MGVILGDVMKKIIIVAILTLFLCVMSACGDNESSSLVSVPSPTPGNNGSTAPSIDSELTAPTLQFADLFLDENDAQRLDTSPLYFTEILGKRKRNEAALPVVFGFQYPFIFYERMTAVVEGTTEEDPAMYVGRYSVETQEVQEFSLDDFHAATDEARLVIDQNRSVYMYCTTGEDGNAIMKIVLFDFSNNTQKLIGTYPVYNVFGYAKTLRSDKLVFLLYESVESGTQQILLLYDFQNDETQEIYRGSVMGGYHTSSISTKDIWAIDTNNGNIDLLMQQFEDDTMHLFLRTIDTDGKILYEATLDNLSMYDSVKDTADSLVTKDNYAFIHFSQFDKDENNDNPPSSILYRIGDEYQPILTDAASSMDTLCSKDSSNSPFLFFLSHKDDNTIYLFDTAANKEYTIALKFDAVQDVVADIYGNILIQTRTDEESIWYLFSSEYIMTLVK